MYSFVAYGLNIHSAWRLTKSPETKEPVEVTPAETASAETAKKEADVVIQMGQVDLTSLDTNRAENRYNGYFIHAAGDKAFFLWDGIGAFAVRGGREIIVDAVPGVEEEHIRLCLLGPVMAALLHQRNLLVIHASAVEINNGVVAFLGGQGWGKSTMAATLYGRGHRLVTDDILAVDISGSGPPLVLPGLPQFKLWPQAAASSLGDDPEQLPRLASNLEKRARAASDGFGSDPIPLKRIYTLNWGETLEIEPLGPQEALSRVIGESGARFHKMLGNAGASAHFLRCAKLINQIPISRLTRQRSLEALASVAELVEKDAS